MYSKSRRVFSGIEPLWYCSNYSPVRKLEHLQAHDNDGPISKESSLIKLLHSTPVGSLELQGPTLALHNLLDQEIVVLTGC